MTDSGALADLPWTGSMEPPLSQQHAATVMAARLPKIPYQTLSETDTYILQSFVRLLGAMGRVENQVCRELVLECIRQDKVPLSESLVHK